MTESTLRVKTLATECAADGNTRVVVWVDCYSTEDIDDIIAWLELTKTLVIRWEEIRRDGAPKKRSAGKAGGVARAAALSPERRSEIATDAANKRWAD